MAHFSADTVDTSEYNINKLSRFTEPLHLTFDRSAEIVERSRELACVKLSNLLVAVIETL